MQPRTFPTIAALILTTTLSFGCAQEKQEVTRSAQAADRAEAAARRAEAAASRTEAAAQRAEAAADRVERMLAKGMQK
jgi:hypothetical protein